MALMTTVITKLDVRCVSGENQLIATQNIDVDEVVASNKVR